MDAAGPAPRTEGHQAPEVAFCLELGRAFLTYGIPAHRFEEGMARICRKLGLEGQFFALPTAFFASLEKDGQRWTFFERLNAADLDLEKLTRLQDLTDDLLAGRLAADRAAAAVRGLVSAPPRWGVALTVACFGLGSVPAACFFGGGWRELALTGALGLLVGTCAWLLGRSRGSARLLHPVAGLLVGFLAVLTASRFSHVSPQIVTISGLIILLPGLRLVVAMNELATGNVVAGTSRLMDTAMTFLALGFGVALGQRLAAPWMESALRGAPVPLPAWTLALALLAVAAALMVLFRARPADFPWILAACVLAFLGARGGSVWLGPQFGVGLGAFLLGLASNLFSRFLRRPSVVPLLPGLMVLVPGGLGFKGLEFIIQKQLMAGLDTAFQALFVAIALLTGLLLAHATVQPRTSL